MVNECRSAMLTPCMNISHLMVHAEKIEEQKLKQVGRESNRLKRDEGNFSNARFEVQGKPRLNKRSSNPSRYNVPKPNQWRRTTPKPQ